MSQPRSATNPLAPGAGIVRYTYVTSGSGYSATPTVTVGAPDIAGGTQATAVAVVKNGALVTVVPTANGSGYLNVPTVTLTDTTGTGAAATAVLGPTPDQLAILGQRAVLTENLQFEVHCWGVGGTSSAISSDPTTDFDATQTLYQQVIVATHLNCAGVYRVAPGKWADALPGATTMNVFGHEFVFGLEFQTPVLDFPLVQAPVNVQPLATLTSDGEAP
jgi:hypothetical protein